MKKKAVANLGSSPRALRRVSWSPRLGGFSMELRMEPSRSAILGVTERGAVRLKGKGEMPLRPETRRRQKTALWPRPDAGPTNIPTYPLPPQTEAEGWLVGVAIFNGIS